MKNRLIQFLPVLLIAFVSFATLGIVQAQNRNPCADTPEAERLLSELTTACSEQSSEKSKKFIEKWEQESRTATIYDTNDKLTTTVYQLLDYLMENIISITKNSLRTNRGGSSTATWFFREKFPSIF